MRQITEGTFRGLARADEVRVDDFCLDAHEVTVGAFAAMQPAPRRTAWGDPGEDWTASRYCNGARVATERHPVNCISLAEARAFCAARGGRLPRSEEWEWAARGASVLSTPWGSPVATNEICWSRPDKRDGTCIAGSFASDVTAAGIADLGGNLSEWTEPPVRIASRRGLRFAHGASWYAVDDGYARAALGGFETPAERAETIGFRCAADVAAVPTPR